MADKTVHPRHSYPSHGRPVLAYLGRPFLLLLLVFLQAGCSSDVRYADGPRSGPVVILGDSLAAGYELPPEEGFVSVLSTRLGVEIVNLGQGGATTAESLPRVEKEVLPLEPSLVIIELGGNDALRKVEVETTRANLQSMVDALHARRIPVLLLGVRGGVFSDKFGAMYKGLAHQNGLGYVPDILEGILTNPGLRIDYVHPNAKGHLLIADRVEPELRRLLERIGKL